jgi:hypothetical protein
MPGDKTDHYHADASKLEEDTAMKAPPLLVLEAHLMPCLWTIYDPWKEFEFGFHGFKPMKDWTAAEMGKDLFTYYKRNVVWYKCLRW